MIVYTKRQLIAIGLIILLLGVSLGGSIMFSVYHHIILPETLEKRASNLGWTEYNGHTDQYEIRENVGINRWHFYYLQHGTMEGIVCNTFMIRKVPADAYNN